MSVTRRTRLSLIAAAASGALVVAMAGTALASDRLDSPNCSDVDLQDAQAALDTAAPSERLRLDDLCEWVPALHSDDTEDADDATPETTPTAAPDAESADDDSTDEDSADKDSADKDSDSDAKDDKDDAEKDDAKSDAKDDEGSDNGDRDCADFDSQADAQAAFEENSEDDPERLDADDDGIACEDHFGTEDQQVAVHPRGGVATGGSGLS
jgi:hypothetical protein